MVLWLSFIINVAKEIVMYIFTKPNTNLTLALSAPQTRRHCTLYITRSSFKGFKWRGLRFLVIFLDIISEQYFF